MVKTAHVARGARKRIRTGIALSLTELCAADVRLRGDGTGVWRTPIEPLNGEAAWPSLESALAGLARALGVADGILAVSLMPPLTEVRRLDLPPLRDDDLQRLLARNASRYFVNARGPQMVGASRIGRARRGEPAPVIAVAASARLIAAIHAAAEQSGWAVESIAPAETAWAAGARMLWPVPGRETAYTIVAQDDRTDVLQLEGGQLTGVRRFRGGTVDLGMIADTVRASTRVGIAGAVATRRELATSLEQFGVRALAPAGEAAASADRGDSLAAHFAGEPGGPVLRSADAAVEDRTRTTRLAWALSVAAAALLVLSAGLELWGVKHQLRVVRAERAALRGQIATTLVGRTTLEAMYGKVASLNAAERSAPQWSAVIAALSEAVPEDAYLTAIRTRQDSLVIDGLGEHAARVFDALANTRGLVDVRAAAPVRREAREDGSALEHFTIAARVEPAIERGSTASPVLSGHPRRPNP